MVKGKVLAGFMVLAFGALAACSGAPNGGVQTGTSVQPLYTAPASYSDHRGQQQLLAVDGGSVAFTDHGKGPAIVLLHGVPTSSWMYRQIIPQLQDDMRVITVDFLGYGSSDKPDDGQAVYSAQAQAGRVAAVLNHIGVSEYGLLMHDMGGLVAWEMLEESPEQISHLIVLNTIVGKTGFNHPEMNPGSFTRQLMKAYTGNLSSVAILKNTFDSMGLKGEHELSEAECFGYVAPIREGSDAALYAFFTNINDDLLGELEQSGPRMARFQGETLVLWGALDDVLTVDQVPLLQERFNIPAENIRIYDDTAHFVAEERPDDVAREIRGFMEIDG